jgi:hypothetical protein
MSLRLVIEPEAEADIAGQRTGMRNVLHCFVSNSCVQSIAPWKASKEILTSTSSFMERRAAQCSSDMSRPSTS